MYQSKSNSRHHDGFIQSLHLPRPLFWPLLQPKQNQTQSKKGLGLSWTTISKLNYSLRSHLSMHFPTKRQCFFNKGTVKTFKLERWNVTMKTNSSPWLGHYSTFQPFQTAGGKELLLPYGCSTKFLWLGEFLRTSLLGISKENFY